jgi:predicted ATPase
MGLMMNKTIAAGEARSCEQPCLCCDEKHECSLIVITGGPGAGKTAVLESVKKVLCEHIAILPEAAGIVFGGGFWRLESDSARMASQRAIFHVQQEMENLVIDEKKWGVGLCDRGTLDGLAYWKGSDENFWETFKTNINSEFSNYKAVIHLRSPSLKHGYNHENPIRIESADEAAQIDERIKDIWKSHPKYYEVASSSSFLEKMNKAISLIKEEMPNCCKGHFK